MHISKDGSLDALHHLGGRLDGVPYGRPELAAGGTNYRERGYEGKPESKEPTGPVGHGASDTRGATKRGA